MKKTALTLAALLALSTNVMAAETGAAAGTNTAATGAAVGSTAAVSVGVAAAVMAAVVIADANDNESTGTVTQTAPK